jgi:hypothetical protein
MGKPEDSVLSQAQAVLWNDQEPQMIIDDQ